MRAGSNDILATATLDIGRDRVATILRLVEQGWNRALTRPGIGPGTPEVELNEWLRDGMRGAVEPRARGRGPKMLVAPGTETRTPDSRVPYGVTDIPIYVLAILEECQDQDPHAIIECKRVAGSDADLCREYVRNGIDRFVGRKYGRRHAVGFMAGYLESGNADHAVRGINRYLTSKNRPDELIGSAVGLKAAWARSSRHPRPMGIAPIDLHHAFLAFK